MNNIIDYIDYIDNGKYRETLKKSFMIKFMNDFIELSKDRKIEMIWFPLRGLSLNKKH